MNSDWEMIETVTLEDKNKLKLPELLREEIVRNHQLSGKCVEWHIDEDTGIMVVANEELPSDRYPHGGRTKVYQTNGRIRPQGDVIDRIGIDLSKGDTLVYLVHGQMLSSAQKCAYVLTKEQCFDLVEAGKIEDKLLVEKLRELFT